MVSFPRSVGKSFKHVIFMEQSDSSNMRPEVMLFFPQKGI
jgi:hypothetical protein